MILQETLVKPGGEAPLSFLLSVTAFKFIDVPNVLHTTSHNNQVKIVVLN